MDKKLFRSLLLLIAFTVGLIFLIVRFDDLWHGWNHILANFTPLFIGLAIAFVLSRPCALFRTFFDGKLKGTALEKISLPLAVTLSYLLLFGVISAIFAFVIPQLVTSIEQFLGNLNGYMAQAQEWINALVSRFQLEELDLSRLDQMLKDLFNAALATLSNAVPHLMSLTSNLVSILITLVLSLVFSIYMLSGKDRLLSQCRRVLRAYTPPTVYSGILDVTALTANTFSKFVTGQVTEACILGALTFTGMVLLRLDYPLLIGVLIGVSALVPIVGAYVGGLTSALLLVMIAPIKALIFLIFLVCLQQFEGNVIYPRVVGTSLGLPGIWVLAAVSVGGGLFGFLGMLLSVPVASILYTLLRRDVHKRLGGVPEQGS